MPDPVLRCDHLVRFYDTPTGRVQAVRGVDLELDPGVAVAVVGPSGSGKSSLLRMLAGLDRPTAGLVLLDGVDVWRLGPRARSRLRSNVLSHVYQRPSDNLFAHLPADMQLRRVAPSGRDGDRVVDETLELLGLGPRRHHDVSTLSGGERQRLALARAVVAGHRVVIADEPTSQLDSDSTDSVMTVVEMLAARGITVVLATHDPRVLDRVDHVITLRDGAVATVTSRGTELAVIDGSGRLQLPPEALALFPDRRARLVTDTEHGEIRLERP